jgi:isoquinoline 1-oxidoreductase alpha subunit
MIMAAAALLAANPKPTDAEIRESMTNICRCGTYNRVRAGIHRAVKEMADAKGPKKSATKKVANVLRIEHIDGGAA